MKKLIIFLSFLVAYNIGFSQTKVIITSSQALINPMNTQGDMIIGGTSGVATRFPAAPHAGMKLTSTSTGSLFAWEDTTVSGGGAIGLDTVQSYASGTTLTQSASTNYIQLNPASTQATLTITTLGSAGVWHTSNDLYIVAGGTLTSGSVITTFNIIAGSGLTLIQNTTQNTMNVGDVIRFHKVGSFLYRIN